MRLPLYLLTASLLWAPAAHARSVRNYGYQQGQPQRPTFWERIKSPHIEEVTKLVYDAQYLRQYVAYNMYYDAHMLPVRRQVMREVMVRYQRAYALEPDNHAWLLEAAHAAFEAAEWEQAVRHYTDYREKQPDQNDVLVLYNLAESELRSRHFDRTIALLEDGLGGNVAGMERARYLTLLGYAFMAVDRLDDATEAFERAAALYPSAQYGGGFDYVALAMLAVAYDRDEQLGRAHDALEQLRSIDPSFAWMFIPQPVMGVYPPSQRMYIPFSPAADRHYWTALFDEAQGKLPEAAAGWRAYLDSHDPVYAARARDHLKDVEKTLAENHKAAKAAKNKKPGAPPPKPAQPVHP